MTCPVPQFTQPSKEWSLHSLIPGSLGLQKPCHWPLTAPCPLSFLKETRRLGLLPAQILFLRSYPGDPGPGAEKNWGKPQAQDSPHREWGFVSSPPRVPAPAGMTRSSQSLPLSRLLWPFKSLSARCRPGSARETIKILCRMKMGQVSSFLAPIQ